MPTQIDDLQRGMYVAVCEKLEEDDAGNAGGFGGPMFGFGGRSKSQFDGRPFQIMEVSLPFVCLSNGYITFGLDLRLWRVQKVSKNYFSAMTEQLTDGERRALFAGGSVGVYGGQSARRLLKRVSKRKRKVRDPGECPRCGDRLVQRHVLEDDKSFWVKFCRNCEFNGGPVGE